MSRFLELRDKAKENKKRIVLPEGEDLRIVKGASFAAEEEIADVFLLGKKEDIEALAKKEKVSLEKVNIIDPSSHDKKEEIVNRYYELRKAKGMTLEEAEKTILDNLVYYGALMVNMDLADGFVAGAIHTTSSVARAAIQCLRIDRNIGTVSSTFLMEMTGSTFGENGLFAYGDCAIIPSPNSRQLAGVAIGTSDLFNSLFGAQPRVAMLSYSTKGSAKSDSAENIKNALSKIKAKRPNLIVDGELQIDAAK